MLAQWVPLLLAILIGSCALKTDQASHTRDLPEAAASDRIEAGSNENIVPAGTARSNRTYLELVAQEVDWRPQGDLAPAVKVYAFGESTKVPSIPGPFLRMRVGEKLRLKVTNLVPPGDPIGLPPPNRRYEGVQTETGTDLTLHGLETAFGAEPIIIPYGETREIELEARSAGEFFYWGETTGRPLRSRTGPESQLTGLVVIDPAEGPIDPDERFFVITMIDAFPEKEEGARFDDIFEPAINGRSWPKTERLTYDLGSDVRWRWINGSGFEHPMHLHGFHFRVLEWSNGKQRISRDPDQEIVTELMLPGTSFSMAWTPRREGAWLIHCHMKDHVAGVVDDHDHQGSDHPGEGHAMRAMDGLVMGVTIRESGAPEIDPPQTSQLRLVAMEAPSEIDGVSRQGYALFDGDMRISEFSAPGPPLFLNKDVATRITVENQLDEPTAVHWHGLELQSMYDGVPGWSRTRDKVAPLLYPGDTYDVVLAPPRAGTFMYHTHMDATWQLNNGMYGPIIVLDTDEVFDPGYDKIILMGDSIDGTYRGVTINGAESPAPIELEAGSEYRLRFINITEGAMLTVSLNNGECPLEWTPIAKDGADLPMNLQAPSKEPFLFNAGETYDFAFTPLSPMHAEIKVDWEFATFVGGKTLSQPISVK